MEPQPLGCSPAANMHLSLQVSKLVLRMVLDWDKNPPCLLTASSGVIQTSQKSCTAIGGDRMVIEASRAEIAALLNRTS